jgi:hypothetical protein
LEKTIVPDVAVCVPAAAAMPPPAPAFTDAVRTLPLSPKLTPLEFENVTALRRFDVVPALKFTFDRSVPLPLGIQSVWLPVGAATTSRTPAEFE